MRSNNLIALALAGALVGVACSSETTVPEPSPTTTVTAAPSSAAPTLPPIEVVPGPVETFASDYGPNIDGTTNAFDAPASAGPPVELVGGWVTEATLPTDALRPTLDGDAAATAWNDFILRGQPDGPFTVAASRFLGIGGAVDEVRVASTTAEQFVLVFDAGGVIVAASLEAAPASEESR